MVIWLNVLFIYKLHLVQNSVKNNIHKIKNDKLLYLSTKTTILSIVSTSILLIMMALAVYEWESEMVYWLIFAFMLIADLYSNFLCILLSYTYYDKYYIKICGLCHRCWIKCCKDENIHNLKMEIVEDQNISKNTSSIDK